MSLLGFRENQPRTENLTSSETRLAALGLTGPIEWEKTYGNFDDGTARKMTLINMDHHLLPLMNKSVAEAVIWMNLALQGGEKGSMWIEPTSQIFMWKEIFGLITLLVTFFSLVPLTNLVLASGYFQPVAQPIPNRYVASPKIWWIFATINALIGGILYPLTTQWGFIGGKIRNLPAIPEDADGERRGVVLPGQCDRLRDPVLHLVSRCQEEGRNHV